MNMSSSSSRRPSTRSTNSIYGRSHREPSSASHSNNIAYDQNSDDSDIDSDDESMETAEGYNSSIRTRRINKNNINYNQSDEEEDMLLEEEEEEVEVEEDEELEEGLIMREEVDFDNEEEEESSEEEEEEEDEGQSDYEEIVTRRSSRSGRNLSQTKQSSLQTTRLKIKKLPQPPQLLQQQQQQQQQQLLQQQQQQLSLQKSSQRQISSSSSSSRKRGSISESSTPSYTGRVLTKRQRAKLEDNYEEDLLELPMETTRKKHLTEEEIALKKSEIARKRKHQSIQRAEQDKMDTINRLLKKQATRKKKADQDESDSVSNSNNNNFNDYNNNNNNNSNSSNNNINNNNKTATASATLTPPSNSIHYVKSVDGSTLSIPIGVEIPIKFEKGPKYPPPIPSCSLSGCDKPKKYRNVKKFEEFACSMEHLKLLSS